MENAEPKEIVLNHGDLVIYTIYDHPKDHPQHFVVRAWVVRDGVQYASAEARLVDSLEAARRLIPEGKIMTPRSPQDDPTIMETWI